MLDVNVGDPLADEVGLMGRAIATLQELTDLPLCIDSSIVEALAAGLAAYDGKALVNSVTAEDDRLEAILPLVAEHGAAVIGLANAEDIPMEPERRLENARKIVSAAGDYGIKPEDVVIDPLAMPVGASPRPSRCSSRPSASSATSSASTRPVAPPTRRSACRGAAPSAARFSRSPSRTG